MKFLYFTTFVILLASSWACGVDICTLEYAPGRDACENKFVGLVKMGQLKKGDESDPKYKGKIVKILKGDCLMEGDDVYIVREDDAGCLASGMEGYHVVFGTPSMRNERKVIRVPGCTSPMGISSRTDYQSLAREILAGLTGSDCASACEKPKEQNEPCMTSGCNGEICQRSDEEPMFSTCDLKPEYACLAFSTCSFNKNTRDCAWRHSDETKACMKRIEDVPEITECMCDGPAPMAPSIECADGSVAGPMCAEDSTGGCSWTITSCPEK